MRRDMGITAVVIFFGLGLSTAASWAQGTFSSEGMGSYVKSPEQKAMEAYSRGLRSKKKAEAENAPDKRRKLLVKAKEELSKSVGYFTNYDGCLALGQVYLLLGEPESAEDACTRALQLKPGDPASGACVEEARRLRTAAAAERGQ